MKKFKNALPNILTFINLSLGVIAILFAVNDSTGYDNLIYASLLIIIAALTDRFDGKVARMLNATSDLGKELDSLSDLISFGLAPTIIAWKVTFISYGIPGYLISLIFPIAGAYRLARYNVTPFNNVFSGLPITIAGAFLTVDNLYNCFTLMTNRFNPVINTSITVVLILLMSFLMISKIKLRKV